MRPPIASPFGEPENLSSGDQKERIGQGASLQFQLSAFCLPRRVIKEISTQPVSMATVLSVITIVTLILFPVVSRAFSVLGSLSFLQLWFLLFPILCFVFVLLVPLFYLPETQREKTVILTSYGVYQGEATKETEWSWPAFLFVVNWSGDVLLTTWTTQLFIPREAFVSPQEAQKFVQIARQLHKTRGAAWRDEWKGQRFGPK